jgi:hypothetical protein
VSTDAQLPLAEVGLVDDVELINDVELVDLDGRGKISAVGVGETAVLVAPGSPIAGRHLAGEADRIAARASTPGTRRQYASSYRSLRSGWPRSSVARRTSRTSTPT